MKINVLEIKNKKGYLVKKGAIHNCEIFINDSKIDTTEMFTISINDKVTYKNNSKILVGYTRGKETMSTEEYRSKPQWYDNGASDENVLRAIANKKELAEYKPSYEECIQKDDIEYKIIGVVEDTKSKHIACTICGQYSVHPIVYTTYGQGIAASEYRRLMEKYSDHADFEEADRDCLRFTKINSNYVFNDGFPFGDYHYRNTFISLVKAQEEEKNIRGKVRDTVKIAVFKNSLTKTKKTNLVSQLKMVKKLKTRKSMVETLNILIDDLSDYKTEIEI